MDASEAVIRTEYLNSGTELMQAHISWPHLLSTGLGMVVALTNSSHPSLVGTNCSAPGRYPPCFIVKEAVSDSVS